MVNRFSFHVRIALLGPHIPTITAWDPQGGRRYFDDAQRQATKAAGTLAGLEA